MYLGITYMQVLLPPTIKYIYTFGIDSILNLSVDAIYFSTKQILIM